MNTNTNYQNARQLFPALCCEIECAAVKDRINKAQYINTGYYEHWSEEHKTQSDKGLKSYSTACRWEQYQAGKISREKAVELAIKRMEKDVEKDKAGRLAKLEEIATAPELTYASVYVNWIRSRTWGHNPAVECYSDSGETSGRASGCGYDKRSAAVAEAFNSSPSIMRVLYQAAEKALGRGETAESKTACTGYSWSKAIGYGAGYSVLPYFEGGVGVSCFWSILNAAGYTVQADERGKHSDYYFITKKAS